LRRQEIAEGLRPRLHEVDRLVDVLGHAERVGADYLAMLLDIGGRHVHRVLNDGFGSGGEPAVEAAVERHAREDRK